MRRRYLSSLYSERVTKIKSLMPHCCIGVDVIVGFPGETEREFLETYEFLNKLDISYLHVFTYSERANTDAITMTGVVPVAERKKRNKMLRILSEKKLRKFYAEHEGTERPVLFEHEERNGMMHGYTDNYVKVKVRYEKEMTNRIVDVLITKTESDGIAAAEFLPVLT